jgi:hypothetical protein
MTANPWISYAVVAVIMIMMMRRNMRGRKLRMERLWVLPAVLAAITVFYLVGEPPGLALGAGLVLALAVGGAAGWQRGRFTRITIDPQTHSFNSQASTAGMILLAALFILRAGLRAYVAQTPHNAAISLAVTDVLVVFALGMVAGQRAEMWIRCRRMLGDAKAQPAG